MIKVAVILAGCGHLDGAEIRESVLTLFALDRLNADVTCFAPDIEQSDVINHLTGKPTNETRNVLVEAARIARGKITPLSDAKANDFDALILPGGFGTAKHLSNLASKGKDTTTLPDYARVVREFHAAHKPIGAICISPAVLTAALKGQCTPHVTIGDDTDGLIASLGGEHQTCQTRGIVIDDTNLIVSTSAYMREDTLSEVGSGIEQLIKAVIARIKSAQKAA